MQHTTTAGAGCPNARVKMLVSSFLISLMAEQPLDLLGPQLVETLLYSIRAT